MARIFENDKGFVNMIIVSMTSFPKRVHLVPIAYKAFIQGQNVKADKSVLWLSRKEFEGEKEPGEIGLKEIVDLGVEIHWCDEDSKIHIRHNSLKLWPDDYNFIIDEDIYYPNNYIQEMMNAAKHHPKCVINYFRIFEYFNGYVKHDFPGFPFPSTHNKFNGGLSLFPPHTFPQSAFKYEVIRDKICPFHDETWVNLFLTYEGGKVFGLHRKKWSVFTPIQTESNIVKLSEVHSSKGQRYSFDVIQFNRVLFVFPQLRKLYIKKSFYMYNFSDREELESYKKYPIVETI